MGEPKSLFELFGEQIKSHPCHLYVISCSGGKFVVTTMLMVAEPFYEDSRCCPETHIVEAIENALTGAKPDALTEIPNFVGEIEKILTSGRVLRVRYADGDFASDFATSSDCDLGDQEKASSILASIAKAVIAY